jgi:Flp pilus assembly protein TadD
MVLERVGPIIGAVGGSGGLLALWLAWRKDRRKSYDQFFDLLREEVGVRRTQFERAAEDQKEEAKFRLEAKEEELVTQSEAFRSNLAFRRAAPQTLRTDHGIVEVDPDLASLLFQVGRLNPALLTAEDHFLQGNTLMELGRPDEAIVAYQLSLDLEEDNGPAWNNLAIALHAVRRFGEAVDAADRAVQLDPTNPVWLNGKLAALNSAGRFEEALTLANEALRSDPNDWMFLTNRANSLRNLKRFDEAAADIQSVLNQIPNEPVALHSMGTTLLDNEDVDGAEPYLKRASELDPTNVHYLCDLARVAEKRDERDVAIDIA